MLKLWYSHKLRRYKYQKSQMKSLFKQITSVLSMLALLTSIGAAIAIARPVLADDPAPLQRIEDSNNSSTSSTSSSNADACKNTFGPSGNVSQSQVDNCLKKSPIISRIQQIVDFLSAGVAIIVVGVILVGGIQYIIAGGNATAVTAARKRITNGVIALAAFLFMFAFLQWLIPGGVFK
jgi:hypothetical protein